MAGAFRDFYTAFLMFMGVNVKVDAEATFLRLKCYCKRKRKWKLSLQHRRLGWAISHSVPRRCLRPVPDLNRQGALAEFSV